MARFVPGGAVMLAALVIPEFSVGAGDLGGGEGVADPPEPTAKQGQEGVWRGSGTGRPPFAGVRYAAMLDMKASPASAREPAAFVPALVAAAMPPAGTPVMAEDIVPASLPGAEPVATGFVPMPPAEALAAGAQEDIAPPASLPVEAVPAMIVAAVPTAPSTAAGEEVGAPSAPAPADAPAGFAVPLTEVPMTQSAAADAASLPVMEPAPAALLPPPSQAAGRGGIEQVTPARIAAAVAAPVIAKAVAPAAARPAPAPAAMVAVPKPAPALTAPASAASSPLAPGFPSKLLTRIDGKTAGAVEFRQSISGLTVRLGSVVEVLAERYDAAQLARIRASAAGNAWLSLTELQAQGVPISYDPVYDEFNIGQSDTRPTSGRKVHMDQISAPERGLGATGMAQVRR